MTGGLGPRSAAGPEPGGGLRATSIAPAESRPGGAEIGVITAANASGAEAFMLGPFSLEPRGFRGCLIEAIHRSGSRARGRSPLRFGPIQPVPVVPVLLAMARVSQWTRGGRDYLSSHIGLGGRRARGGPETRRPRPDP